MCHYIYLIYFCIFDGWNKKVSRILNYNIFLPEGYVSSFNYRNESNPPSLAFLAKLGFISCWDSPLHHLLLNNIKQFKIPFSIPYNHSYNTWVPYSVDFPVKQSTVKLILMRHTRSVRALINQRANFKRKICIFYLYVKHYNFKIVLYANWVPMPSISIRWKRFKEDRSYHAFYVQWKATYINNRCNIKLK